MRLHFRDCAFDPETRELLRSGEAVTISTKAFDLLSLLLAERPRPVSHARLRDRLWPDTHVTHTSLPRVVNEVRRAIGDSGRAGSLIRTVARFGYSFAGAVREDAPGPAPGRCALVGADRDHPLPEGRTRVGRGAACGVQIVSTEVSRVHAFVDLAGTSAVVVDNDSKNGTWVNGTRIGSPTRLEDGDEVVFGTARLLFRSEASQVTTRTARPR